MSRSGSKSPPSLGADSSLSPPNKGIGKSGGTSPSEPSKCNVMLDRKNDRKKDEQRRPPVHLEEQLSLDADEQLDFDEQRTLDEVAFCIVFCDSLEVHTRPE